MKWGLFFTMLMMCYSTGDLQAVWLMIGVILLVGC